MQRRIFKAGGIAALVTIVLILGPGGERLSAQAAMSVTVKLGDHGGEITLVRQEGQATWMQSGSTETFTSGTEVTAEYMGVTNSYVVTLDTDTGTWSAEYRSVSVTVDLGASGETLEVIRAEDTTWQLDSETPFSSGDTYMLEGGNTYMLSYTDGEWSAKYVPATMMIAGTGLTAVANEDGSGYTIMDQADQTLDQAGMGDVMSVYGNFRVHMDDDGNLIGMQYEEPLDGENTDTGTSFGDGMVTVSVDDTNTDRNEAGTMIIIDGVSHSTGKLLKPVEFDTTLAEVLVEVESLVSEIKGLIAVIDSEPDDTKTDFSDQFDTKWHAIDVLLDQLFGADRTDAANESEIDNLETRPGDSAELVEQLDAVLAALADADTLEAATVDEGVFKGKTITVSALYGTGMSTVEGENIVAGVLDEIEALVAQIKAFVAVNDAEADDARTDFSDQFDTRWHAIDVLLDKVFGADRTDVADESEIDNLETRPSDSAEMVAQLDAILAALGDADAFAAAMEDDGIYEDKITDDDDISATFDAVDSTATAYLGRTENTRFGIFTKQGRSTAADEFGDATYGVFAYSPLEPARYADLPTTGAANYEGRTMAIDGGGETMYAGDISLEVRFRARRVSGLVENLLDADGNPFQYGSGEVAGIILANATISTDGAFNKDGEARAQIVFTPVPGSPGAETLERLVDDQGDPAQSTDQDATDVGSGFEGRFVSDGAAVIGTWAISASAEESDNLTGAFGAERGETVAEQPPDTGDGGGKSETSLSDHPSVTADIVSSVDAEGVITLVSTPEITVNGTDLYRDGGAVINGKGLVEEATEAIQGLVARLNTYINLGNLGEETIANNGKEQVWDDIADVFDRLLFGSGSGGAILDAAANVDTGNYPTDDGDLDDDAAKAVINRLLDALSTSAKFTSAVAEGGVLFVDANDDDNNDNLNPDTGAVTADDVFNRVRSTVTVEFASTSYTRFGVWNQVSTEVANVEPSEAANPSGVFAYSQLTASTYTPQDPNFPAGLNASYEGATIARDQSNNYYEGSITIDVTWAANVGTGTTSSNVGTVTALINNLRSNGALYTNGTANGTVDTIIFTATDIHVARNEDNSLSFDSDGGGIRLRHSDIRVASDGNTTGNIDGLFVGKSIDGPLGVLGSWSMEGDAGESLVGAYGADLLQ